MHDDLQKEIWHTAVFWHGVDLLPQLREMPPEERKQVLKEANELNLSNPLFYYRTPHFSLPSLPGRKLSGGQVAALLVFGLWVECGERDEICSTLLKEWPEIKLAAALVDGHKRR